MAPGCIAPMCIRVKDHSSVLCEQLQQLRQQTGLVDLDIVCEGHLIRVHKVVLAACSRFFKEQLCKYPEVQSHVILRLEDFGLELKRDAVNYIIEFVYRGEVDILGEKLTDFCAAAHTLGVLGLEHLPVPATPQRPPCLSKEHLQIADESELRGETSSAAAAAAIYNLQQVTNVQQGGMAKLSMMDGMNVSSFFQMNTGDDIMILHSGGGDGDRSGPNGEQMNPEIIPISFGETVLSSSDVQGQRLYGHHHQILSKENLTVSENSNEVGDDPYHHHHHRGIPEILPDPSYEDEGIDAWPSLFPHPSQSLDPATLNLKNQEILNVKMYQRSGKCVTAASMANSMPPTTSDIQLTMSGNTLQALFDAASSTHHNTDLVMPSNVVTRSLAPTFSTAPSGFFPAARPPSLVDNSSKQPMTPLRTAAANCTLVDSKKLAEYAKGAAAGRSISQGKLRVINQGMQSENIQTPANMADTSAANGSSGNKARRRSGQVGHLVGGQVVTHIPSQVSQVALSSQVAHITGQVGHVVPGGAVPVSAACRGTAAATAVRLLSVSNSQDLSLHQDQGDQTNPIAEQNSGSDSEEESDHGLTSTGISTPCLSSWNTDEMWSVSRSRQNTDWTHPVESVDTTAVPTSGAVWQLPSTQPTPHPPVQPPWSLTSEEEETATAVNAISHQLVDSAAAAAANSLRLLTPVGGGGVNSGGGGVGGAGQPRGITWNTPVNENSREGKYSGSVTVVSSAGPRDTPPNMSVSWTQPQTSSSPAPAPPPAGGGEQQAQPPTSSFTSSSYIAVVNTVQSEDGGTTSSSSSASPSLLRGPDGDDLGIQEEEPDEEESEEQERRPTAVTAVSTANTAAPSSWNSHLTGSLTKDDNMLAIRSGIPLALQNKAIRSGVPIGPFQTKRKRKSMRLSLDSTGGAAAAAQQSSPSPMAGRARKQARVASIATSGGGGGIGGPLLATTTRKGDLEVRKDLTIESQRTEIIFLTTPDGAGGGSSSCSSVVVTRAKEEDFKDATLSPSHIAKTPPPPPLTGPLVVGSGGGVQVKTVKKLNAAVMRSEGGGGSNCSEAIGTAAGGQQYSCPDCAMAFYSVAQLKRHLQFAHGREEQLFCQVCSERLVGKEKLKLHMYREHGIGEMFRCEECNFESSIKAGYIKHLSEHEPQEERRKTCPKCEKVFKTKAGLRLHLKQHFDEESLLSCLACEFRTPQKTNLVRHMATKHGQDMEGRLLDMQFKCNLCEFECVAEHLLKNHVLRKHTQKEAMRFQCNSCDYASVEKAALEKHYRFKHTKERPFMCDTCGFSTHTASAHARHKRSHSQTKPHRCSICGHEYADRKRLRDHMYTHTNQDPFKCQFCSYSCRRKDNLTAHLKKHHNFAKEESEEKAVVIPDSTSEQGEQQQQQQQQQQQLGAPSYRWRSALGEEMKPSGSRSHSPSSSMVSVLSTTSTITNTTSAAIVPVMSTIEISDIAVSENPPNYPM